MSLALRRSLGLISLSCWIFVAGACGGPGVPPPQAPTAPKVAMTEAPAPVAVPPAMTAAQIREATLATMVVGDLRGMVAAAREHAGPALPLPPASQLEAVLASALGMGPELARALDLSRPLALVITALGRGQGPQTMIAVPVRSFPGFLRGLEEKLPGRRAGPAGTHVFPIGKNLLHVASFRDYAALASAPELVAVAPAALTEVLEGAPPRHAVIRLAVATLWRRYGPALEKIVKLFAAGQGDSSGLGGSLMKSSTATWLRYLRGTREVTIDAVLGPRGFELAASAHGTPRGALADLVRQQATGPLWGAEHLPQGTVLMVGEHRNPDHLRKEADEALERATDILKGVGVDLGLLEGLGDALRPVYSTLGDRTVLGVWPVNGGLAGGSVSTVTDEGATREALRKGLAWLTRSGMPAMRKKLKGTGVKVTVRVRRNAFKVGKARADVLEARVRLPRDRREEAKVMQALFGSKVAAAWLVTKGRLFFVFGKDLRGQLQALVAKPTSNITSAPGFAQAVGYRDQGRVQLFYLRAGDAARLAGQLALATTKLDPKSRHKLKALETTHGAGAVVATTNARGTTYAFHLRIDASAIKDLMSIVRVAAVE